MLRRLPRGHDSFPVPILRIAIAGFALYFLMACQPTGQEQAGGNDFVLTIIGTNDIHGAVAANDGRGGLPMLAAYVNALRESRARDGGALLLIDAGDMWQGTLESNLGEGKEIVAAFNSMGYAAAAIGNHEFDFGPEGPEDKPVSASDDPRGNIKARAAEADFPLLAANLIDEATGRPVDWPNVVPAVILDVKGVKVGVIGVVTQEAFITTLAANTGGLSIAPLAETVIEQATALREQGASLVIVTAHAGGRCTDFSNPADLSSCQPAAEIFALAEQVPRGLLDHIIAGHVHAGLAHVVNGITITSAYTRAEAFGRVDFVMDGNSGSWTSRRVFAPQSVCERVIRDGSECVAAGSTESVAPEFAGRSLVEDPAVLDALGPAFERAVRVREASLGISAQSPIRLHAGGFSPLGNLFADGLLAAVPEADIAIHNSRGGLRTDLPPGDLTFGDIYRVFPFSNRVVSFELTAEQLKRVFEKQLRRDRGVQISFAGLQVSAGCDTGRMAIDFFLPTGEKLGEDERVIIASNDFLVTGGDGIFEPVIPQGGLEHDNDGPLMRDVVIDYLRGIDSPLQETQFAEAQSPRLLLPQETLPLDCSLSGASAAGR